MWERPDLICLNIAPADRALITYDWTQVDDLNKQDSLADILPLDILYLEVFSGPLPSHARGM